MKDFTRRFALTIALFSGVVAVPAIGQLPTISGPIHICSGSCGTYQIAGGYPSGNPQIFWQDNTGFFSSEPVLTYCPQAEGNYWLIATGEVNGLPFTDSLFITVSLDIDISILSTQALCPDTLSVCDKVCAGATVQYIASGAGPNDSLVWSVIGADNFSATGNSLTVTWGNAGQGLVTVELSDQAAPPPMQVFCGQLNIKENTPGSITGTGFLQVLDSPGSVAVTVTGPGGYVSNSTSSGSFFLSFDQLEAGTYTVVIADNNGNVLETCSFDIVTNDSECWANLYPVEFLHASSCNACDGFIQVQPTGGGQLNYTVNWSTGVTGYTLNNLCPGTYSATVTDAVGCTFTRTFIISCPSSCEGSDQLCVDVLPEPQAVVSSIPAAVGDVIQICEGQTVFFENLSQHATAYAWYFGNGNTSAQFSPSQTYPTAGSYTVTLVARNQCFCADTTYLTVNVLPVAIPDIQCTGTVCEGETATYSTSANCSTYHWTVSPNGTILAGGGPTDNTVTVLWNSGPEGLLSLSASGCASAVCNQPNAVPIPIVSDNVQIMGNASVCQGSEEEYFIPNFQGTEINWTVVGSGTILEGQGSERISVHWYGEVNAGNPQLVIVEFDNCYLGCGGRDTLEVNILPNFFVTGPIEVCYQGEGSYTSRNAITLFPMQSNWQLLDANGAILQTLPGPANTASITFNVPPGRYIVRAKPAGAGFCNLRYDRFVEVLPLPPAPTGISGPLEICPGQSYTYSAAGSGSNTISWVVQSGGSTSTANGNPVVVTWGPAAPYQLSAYQVATSGLGCISEPFSLGVQAISNFAINGKASVCHQDEAAYSATFFENEVYEWSISPAEAGTILTGQGTEALSVQWNLPGTAILTAKLCGINRNFPVEVLPLPSPAVTDPGVCPGQTVVVSTTLPFVTHEWKDENGTVISIDPSVDLGVGYYEVEVTGADGCRGHTIFEVVQYPQPSVSISTPAYYALCTGGPPATLYALNTEDGYSYQWYRDGTPVGTNSETYSTTNPGIYHVVVTDVNGCTAISNQIELVDCEAIGGTCVGGLCLGVGGGPPLPSCTPLGFVDFNPVQTSDCNVFDFVNTSVNYVPGTFSWYFGDPASGAANTSNLQEPSHTFSGPGFFTVILLGDVNAVGGGSCTVGLLHDVLVPAVADFSYSQACPGSVTGFDDASQFVSGETIMAWDWDFDDPASGANNTAIGPNPTHVFDLPGLYDVTLTITMSSGCQTSVMKTVEVLAVPSINILAPTVTCEQTALPFTALPDAGIASLSWDFGDPTSGAANFSSAEVPFHQFSTAGNYTITLTGTSIRGCTTSAQEVFAVTPNNLSGTISAIPDPPICEGDQTLLSAPPGGISWLWSNGSTDEQFLTSLAGVYSVTLSDATGCSYTPPELPVQVIGEPNGIIKAVEYNEYGQPVAFHESSFSACEGEDVTLTIIGSSNYGYTWSDGSLGNEISYSNTKGNLLPVGTHPFTVTVTDYSSGCTSVEGPFDVTVREKPDAQISSIPAGFLCENTTAVLNVTSPDPTYTYQWNTGETGNSITVVTGGTYFVEATNTFGCASRSNAIELHNAPDVDLVPSGCYTRCNPDTICLPNMAGVASYQWFLNGNPIPPPGGTAKNPIFDQSGTYHVVVTDVYGCTSTSEPLSLDLFTGFGYLSGNVWFDVNQNGVIDPADSLLPGIPILLFENGSPVGSATSSGSGFYLFGSVTAGTYSVAVDTAGLSPGWIALIYEGNADINGCDVQVQTDFLLTKICLATFGNVDFSACQGDSVLYQGVNLPAGFQGTITLTNAEGCDSSVLVTVNTLPPSPVATIDLSGCEGDTVNYLGLLIPVGQSDTLTLSNWLGCDSFVVVNALPLPASPVETVNLSGCQGDTVSYLGVQVPVGQSDTLTLSNWLGCDSFVVVNALPLPASPVETVALSGCQGDTVSYLGVQIPVGQSDTLTLSNWLGCDSFVVVNAQPWVVGPTNLQLGVCQGDSVWFNGQYLHPGDAFTTTLTSVQGCDSVVTVVVGLLPHTVATLEMTACENSFVEYQGQVIYPGEVVSFESTNADGCTDTLIITVLPLQVDSASLTLEACGNETILYNGVELPAGSQQYFTLTNQFGCDSVVLVAVAAVPYPDFGLAADTICWNDPNGALEVIHVTGGTAPFSYSLDGSTFQLSPVFSGLSGGAYTVLVTNGEGCTSQQFINLPAIGPVIIASETLTIDCGDQVLLQPIVASPLPYSFTWADGFAQPIRLVDKPGTYLFTVTNDCETRLDSAVVQLRERGDTLAKVYIPNAFSPNTDGINDCFRGYVEPGLEVIGYELRVFNRWGDLVFETADINGCWNGRFKGKLMDPAVLVWYMRYSLRNCAGEVTEVFREGGVHLLR